MNVSVFVELTGAIKVAAIMDSSTAYRRCGSGTPTHNTRRCARPVFEGRLPQQLGQRTRCLEGSKESSDMAIYTVIAPPPSTRCRPAGAWLPTGRQRRTPMGQAHARRSAAEQPVAERLEQRPGGTGEADIASAATVAGRAAGRCRCRRWCRAARQSEAATRQAVTRHAAVVHDTAEPTSPTAARTHSGGLRPQERHDKLGQAGRDLADVAREEGGYGRQRHRHVSGRDLHQDHHRQYHIHRQQRHARHGWQLRAVADECRQQDHHLLAWLQMGEGCPCSRLPALIASACPLTTAARPTGCT